MNNSSTSKLGYEEFETMDSLNSLNTNNFKRLSLKNEKKKTSTSSSTHKNTKGGVWTYYHCSQWYQDVHIHTSSSTIPPYCIHHQSDHVTRVETDETFPTKPFETAAIALVEPTAHTMAYALPNYTLHKVPTSYIYVAAQLDVKFSVWGIFDAHIIPYAWQRGYQAELLAEATWTPKSNLKAKKLINAERPRLFKLTPRKDLAENKSEFYVLAVFPGSDYVYHYARMVHQVMETMKRGSAQTLLEVRRFPQLEQKMVNWMALDTLPIEKGDVVLFGHVRDYLKWLFHFDKETGRNQFEKDHKHEEPCNEETESKYFQPLYNKEITMNDIIKEQQEKLEEFRKTEKDHSEFLSDLESLYPQGVIPWTNWAYETLSLPEQGEDNSSHRIFLLGARYSYWGNIVRPIAEYVYSITDYIIYAAKCGTMKSEENIEKIVVPHLYTIVEEPNDVSEARFRVLTNRCHSFIFGSNLAKNWRQDECSVSGIHVSVPTLVGETYSQQQRIYDVVKQDSEVRQLSAQISRRLKRKGVDPETIKQRKTLIKKLPTSKMMMHSLQHWAYEYLSPKEVKELLEEIASKTKTSNSNDSLLSMDNETSWFMAVAGERRDGVGNIPGDDRVRFFQAIHRTTDYVRKAIDAAKITPDDLAAEHTHNRDELLKKMGKMLFELLVENTLPKSSENEKSQLSWGILSTAQISSKFIKALNSSEKSQLKAIATRKESSRKQSQKNLSEKMDLSQVVYIVDNNDPYQIMMERQDIDAVYIPLPNSMHLKYAQLALKYGKHVLIEKPAVLHVLEALDLNDSMKKHPDIYMAQGMPFLYHPLITRLQEYITHDNHNEGIGSIQTVHCTYKHPIAKRGLSCIAMKKELGGGCLYALGCYPIALFVLLFPEIVYCEPHIEKKTYLEESNVSPVDLRLTVNFPISKTCTLTMDVSMEDDAEKEQQLVLKGDDGTITVPYPFFAPEDESSYFLIDKEPNNDDNYPPKISEPPIDPFSAELNHFEEAVLSRNERVEKRTSSMNILLQQTRVMDRVAQVINML